MNNFPYTVAELQELWGIMFPGVPDPSLQQFGIWITRFGNDAVREGMAQTAIKFRKMKGDMTAEFVYRYASAAMRRESETAHTSAEREQFLQYTSGERSNEQ